METALLTVYEANEHFSIRPGRYQKFLYIFDLLHPNEVTLNVSKIMLYVLVSQGASKMLAVKVVASSVDIVSMNPQAFEKFHNAIFFKIFKFPFNGQLVLVQNLTKTFFRKNFNE